MTYSRLNQHRFSAEDRDVLLRDFSPAIFLDQMPDEFEHALTTYYEKRCAVTIRQDVFVCSHQYGNGVFGVLMGVAKRTADRKLIEHLKMTEARLKTMWHRELSGLVREARDSDVLLLRLVMALGEGTFTGSAVEDVRVYFIECFGGTQLAWEASLRRLCADGWVLVAEDCVRTFQLQRDVIEAIFRGTADREVIAQLLSWTAVTMNRVHNGLRRQVLKTWFAKLVRRDLAGVVIACCRAGFTGSPNDALAPFLLETLGTQYRGRNDSAGYAWQLTCYLDAGTEEVRVGIAIDAVLAMKWESGLYEFIQSAGRELPIRVVARLAGELFARGYRDAVALIRQVALSRADTLATQEALGRLFADLGAD